MRRSAAVLTLAIGWIVCPARAAEQAASDLDFFEKKVRPVLIEHCHRCHAGAKVKGGLRLDAQSGVLKGGDSGPALVPGHPDKSLLLDVVSYNKDVKMPPKGKLPDAVIADLGRWVKRGAAWPAESVRVSSLRTSDAITNEDRAFWSFQRLSSPVAPTVRNEGWIQKPLDRFVLAKLEDKGLRPVAAASKRVLIRRATYDLTGLPPTPEEIDAFLADSVPEAFARVVDRLLSSPHYGERWGRYWLDVARYAEDQAHTFQARQYPNAYRYRDWVVKAYQDDMPFDRFILEQVAGDLLADGDKTARLPALGYFAIGPVYYNDAGEAKAAEAAELDDRIDTLGRGFLGLTVACARCHDHKFDPISVQDYYVLAGVFKSSKYVEAPLVPQQLVEQYNATQKRIKDQETKVQRFLEAETARQAEALGNDTTKYIVAAWKLSHERKANPGRPTATVAGAESVDVQTLERWQQYLFGAGSEKRARLVRWRAAVRRLEKAFDLASFAAAWSQTRLAAATYQAELVAVLRERATAGAKLDKAKTEWLKEVISPQGLFRFDPTQVEKRLASAAQQDLARQRAELVTLKKSLPQTPPICHSLTEGQPADMHVYLRGNHRKEGDLAPRRFLRVLSGAEPPRFTQGSGRLELARAIASPENPLTARVLVNRLWQHHFGKGLVATPSNFGRLGRRPTHPELLDHLAGHFLTAGWSIKAMHREIMLSATYQLGSSDDDANAAVDGNNDLLWRMNRQRLDVEAWRDSLLAVAGNLDPTLGGPPQDLAAAGNRRRTLYAKISRHNLDGLLRLFDFPDPNITSESRTTTIGPLQQLFVLNSGFMVEQARSLARRLAAESNDASRIRSAYLRLYGRPETERELSLGLGFLASPAATEEPAPRLTRWEQYAQVLLSANELIFVD